MTTPQATMRGETKTTSRYLVVALCSVAIIIDGYDLIVYGTVVPTFLGGTAEWTLTKPQAGAIGAYALVGMLIGAIAIGTITDLAGRRRIMIACIGWFSTAMVCSALAPDPTVFGLTRFLAGLGLGGLVPTAIALTIEYAHPRHRSTTNALMFSGYSIGGIIVSLTAIEVIPALGWRAMFWIGAGLGVVLLPLVVRYLPESAGYLLARGRHAEAEELAHRFGVTLGRPARGEEGSSALSGLRSLFAPKLVAGTVLFWLGTGIGLLLVYGLNTWLAQIMREAGYELGSAIAFILALNLGAIIGTPLLGALADRVGSKRVIATMFLTAALSIFGLSFALPTPLLYVLVTVAGACTIGTTILVNAYTATYYPARMRATGLGWALGVGRLGAILGPIYGSYILASGWGLDANFYAFAVPAVVGMLCILLIPAPRPAS
ncbi:MFS transporter [Nocardia aurea]|uniref:MFS transporter n=1 Tax=Nocardia aurea TaxID=2144174 RepID=UPI0018E57DBC|nr:aromatic acid/H+ symport family MFS transporter [Nocardia aurea]